MSNIITCVSLSRSGSLGWRSKEVRFADRPIVATIQLSAFSVQSGERFDAYQPHYAYAYLETVKTPKINTGWGSFPAPNRLKDNYAWLTTDHLTFHLQSDIATGDAAAIGMIYDRGGLTLKERVLDTVDLAVYDQAGVVVGAHQVVRLEGGAKVDADEVQGRVLSRAQAQAEKDLAIVPVDLGELASGEPFRIDPRTKRLLRIPDRPGRGGPA